MPTPEALTVAVLGAAGTIAPGIVRDLSESEEVERMLLLDLDEARAEAVAAAHGGGKARAQAIDASEAGELPVHLEGVDVLVNTASYRVNLEAMRACLVAGCNYLDLGGLYWMTGRQLQLSDEFDEAEQLALLGIGSSPGTTNLMAVSAVRELGPPAEGTDTIEVFAGGLDPGAPDDGHLRPPYALQTLIDELTLAPVLIRDGAAVEVEPLTAGGPVDFGPPVGVRETIYAFIPSWPRSARASVAARRAFGSRWRRRCWRSCRDSSTPRRTSWRARRARPPRLRRRPSGSRSSA